MRLWQSDQYATNMFGLSFSLHILYSVLEASIGNLVSQNVQGRHKTLIMVFTLESMSFTLKPPSVA